ncbi:MAG: aspartate-semialdehyde dehydrogenase [Alphaproteobacteria bacterium CG_4_10_14_0_2_um_filter_63_37]|nr:MAG: aspartate-semialdehyde dehydrogenase [Proteobacteria bacterium CG1_02_64_396]PJA24268.1 MAG: aspartate-semialdehyde dehydrogenase [Alphaproteobacteria bacterium CG_4_10_14_0_2_um_filter_63_37]
MSELVDIAVLGATGAVGETVFRILEERNFPVGKLYPLASSRSAGGEITFRNEEITVLDAAEFDWSQVKVAIFSAGGSVSAEYAPKAAAAGCTVIDNTSHFRMDPDVPLVVPEVNPEQIFNAPRGIIANPNCSTIQMVVALKPLHDVNPIRRIVVSTYQATSGAGRSAMDELFEQTRALYTGEEMKPKKFPKRIAFNCIPQIDSFLEDGYTKEEVKMMEETRKIMGTQAIRVTATTVRVPVFYGHAESVNVEFERPFDPNEARAVLSAADGVVVMDAPQMGLYPTQADCGGTDPVYVGRLRNDPSHENCLNMWIVADNLRKGAALNAVQIAEILIQER